MGFVWRMYVGAWHGGGRIQEFSGDRCSYTLADIGDGRVWDQRTLSLNPYQTLHGMGGRVGVGRCFQLSSASEGFG